MKTLTTFPGYFDGKEIKLDSPVSLEPNTRLLVTVLSWSEDEHQQLIYETMLTSEKSFMKIWDNDEDAVYDDL